MTNIQELKIIYHYPKHDSEFIDDYCGVSLWINGDCIQEYGDDYHDKGDSKVEGFVDCLKFLKLADDDDVIEENINDYEM